MEYDTLNYHFKRPAFLFKNKSDYPLSGCITIVLEHLSNMSDVVPEQEALNYYLYNHVTSIIRRHYHEYEPLGSVNGIVDDYVTITNKSSIRAYCYLLLICTRESRHIRQKEHLNNLKVKYGKAVVSFTEHISGVSSGEAVQRFLNSSIESTIGNYTGYLVKLFNGGKFSPGYGGKAWGNVAQALHNFVIGVYSPEMLLDTVFTLAHNNGPIFNKGIFYTQQSNRALTTILDVQRAGEIPNFMLEGYAGISSVLMDWAKDTALNLNQVLNENNLPRYTGVVDWHNVHKYGVHSYADKVDKPVLPAVTSKLAPNSLLSGNGISPFPLDTGEVFSIPGLLTLPKLDRSSL